MANTKITAENIADGTITNAQIADGTIGSSDLASGARGPVITSVSGVLTPDTSGNISITGQGFSGSNVYVDVGATSALTAASSVTVNSTTSITATLPGLSAGTYKLYVINSNGESAIFPTGVLVSPAPSWTTAAGSLGSSLANQSASFTVAASSDSTITYSVTSGSSLPSGMSLNSSTGVISGTMPNDSSQTTYNFTLTATDAESQSADRAFSILNIVPDLYYDFTASSTLPSTVTHSRSESSTTVASYYDSNRYVQFVSTAGDPRFTHDPETGTNLGLLNEEERANWQWDSDTPLGTGWATFGASRTRSVVSNITLPTGTTGNCISYSVSAGTNTYSGQYHTQWGSSGAGWYSFSFYIKRTSGDAGPRIRVYNGSAYYLKASFNLTTGEVSHTENTTEAYMEALPNDWYRCHMTAYTSSNATGSPAHFSFEIGNETQQAQNNGNYNASQLYLWGFQFEPGRGSTSYIKNLSTTLTNTVTRNSDIFTVQGTDWSNVSTGNSYSAVMEGRTLTTDTGNQHLMSFLWSGAYAGLIISDGASGTILANQPYIKVYNTEGVAANGPSFTHRSDFKVGGFWSSSRGGGGVTLNGSTVVSDGGGTGSTPTYMSFGGYGTGANFRTQVAIKKIYFFDSDVGNSLLETLTT